MSIRKTSNYYYYVDLPSVDGLLSLEEAERLALNLISQAYDLTRHLSDDDKIVLLRKSDLEYYIIPRENSNEGYL